MTEITLNVEDLAARAEGHIAVLETASEELRAIQVERAAKLEQINEDAREARALVAAEMKARAEAIASPAAEASRELNAWAGIGLIDAGSIPSFIMPSLRSGRGTGAKAAVMAFLELHPGEQFTGAQIKENCDYSGIDQLLQTMIADGSVIRTKLEGTNRNLYQFGEVKTPKASKKK